MDRKPPNSCGEIYCLNGLQSNSRKILGARNTTAGSRDRTFGHELALYFDSFMANILYGVNGEGSGHSTRALEVLSHLQARGHTLHVASFDRGLRNLQGHFEVTEIYGLR